MTITSHILFRKACEAGWMTIDVFDYYFERKKKKYGRGHEGATKIHLVNGFLKSDAIFLAESSNLFCLEIHNQYRVSKIVKQLKPYAYALAEWSPSIKYNVERNAKILIVFQKESTMRSALEIASSDTFYLHMRDYFLLKTYDWLHKDPLKGRRNLHDKEVWLFSP